MVELRDFAQQIVEARTLAGKLRRAPAGEGALTDEHPEPIALALVPGRPAELAIVPAAAARTPPLEGMADPHQRARIVHAFANHELQAVELFAWALLAFPGAPGPFRRGLLGILGDEQRHLEDYCTRLAALGTPLGSFPVSGFFWGKLAQMATPRRFLCAMALTFEQANLDHSLEFATAARRHGDVDTARLLERVHEDELRHVGFGLTWLERMLEPGETLAQAYERETLWPLRAERASGRHFDRSSRLRAGMPPELIDHFEAAGPDRDALSGERS